jgi:hypothetical protein
MKPIQIKRKMRRSLKGLNEEELKDFEWLKTVTRLSRFNLQMMRKLIVFLLYDNMRLDTSNITEIKENYSARDSEQMILCKRNMDLLFEMYLLKEKLDEFEAERNKVIEDEKNV